MDISKQLVQRAKALTYDSKRDYLLSLPEVEIHKQLKCLFEKMEDNAVAEITHQADEHGRDLVIRREDAYGQNYVGVVVKKGDAAGKITARSAGIVDEVISQVRQAFTHPFFSRELAAGAVKINSVYVVFVGRFTDEANERIERELKEMHTRIFPILWLVDKFTEHYPEIFFEGPLSDFLQQRIVELETKQEFSRKPINLSESYVDPWISKSASSPNLDDDLLQMALRRERLPFAKLRRVIQSNQRILLAGDPGTGKSAALAKIALDMLHESLKNLGGQNTRKKVDIPILIKAAKFADFSDCDSFKNNCLPPAPLRDKFQVNVLLIDGLDELKPDTMSSVVDKATRFSVDLNCGLVITSRKMETIKDVMSPFERYELLPFEFNQAMKLIERLVDNKAVIDIVKEGLQKADMRISITPLSLQLLIEIAESEREIPGSITEVYDRFVDIALGRYDHGIDMAFEYIIKKSFLAELAWFEFYKKNRLATPSEDFTVFVNHFITTYGYDIQKLQHFIVEIQRAGILRIGQSVIFRHRSFLDYFAAFWLKEHQEEINDSDTEIVNLYFNPMWTDVAFYYIGLRRKISKKMVEGIANYSDNEFEIHILKFLIGRLLQAGWNSTAAIKIQGISSAMESYDPIRDYVDTIIKPNKERIPTIFTDFFIQALGEYSFGSKTLAKESITICNDLLSHNDAQSMRKALLLLWANRNSLDTNEIEACINQILITSTFLEKQGELTLHDKAVTLLFLEFLEEEDERLRSIRRKIDRVKRLYPAEMALLLPAPTKGYRRKKRKKYKQN